MTTTEAPSAPVETATEPQGEAAPTGEVTPQTTEPSADWREGISEEYRNHPSLATAESLDDVVKAAIAASDYKSGLPDELRNEPSIQDVGDVPALVKKLVNAEKKIGAKGVIIPGKDATPEERAAFHQALGAPEKPDGYELPKENMPEVQLDESLVDGFKKFAHENGIPKSTFAELVRFQAKAAHEAEQRGITALQEGAQKVEAALRSEWGQAADERLSMARDAAKELLGDDDQIIALVGNSPTVLKNLYQYARDRSEDAIVGHGQGRSFKMSPADAKAEISKLRNDEGFQKAYTDPMHPDHSDAMEKIRNLYKIANPEPVT